jgi:hypothetical protein
MDWIEWHSAYDDPGSSLSRRLVAVREALDRALERREGAVTQLVSICAGDGRDALPVLASRGRDVAAVLLELDPTLAAAARAAAVRLGVGAVEVREGDAGMVDSYDGIARADVFLACGVFGNVTDDDLLTTVQTLPQLLSEGATVIWTRGCPSGDPTDYDGDPADFVRGAFSANGFDEVEFVRPSDADFRVGVHRLVAEPAPRQPGATMFRFVR